MRDQYLDLWLNIMSSERVVRGLYRYSCPNCYGVNSDLRLVLKAPCAKCIDEKKVYDIIRDIGLEDYYKLLKSYAENTYYLKKLHGILKIEEEVRELEKFFSDATGGYRFWSAQRTWAKRVLKGKSFSIIAPTGMGKTMFGLVTALYFYKRKRGKVYLVFPTTPLLNQAYEKLLKLSKKAGINPDIVFFHSKIPKKTREEFLQKIDSGEFDILLTTSRFIHKYVGLLKKHKYSFIMVDDVDAILRSGKSIRLLLEVIGFDKDIIESALELIKKRIELIRIRDDDERKAVRKQIEDLEKRISRAARKIKTVLVVSSATGRPRGLYPKLFRILLNFEAGSRGEAIRNIVDTYLFPEKSIEEHVVELVKKLGSGGLVYVPVDKGIEYAEKIAGILCENGVKAEAFHARKGIEVLEAFSNGEIDVLVGVATYYGVMVRGLDLPERIRYAVFAGVPRHKFSSHLENPRPYDIIRILSILRDILEGDEKHKVELYIGRISSRLRRLTQAAVAILGEELQKALSGQEYRESVLLKILLEALDYARKLLAREDIQKKLRRLGDIGFVEENGRSYLLIPDVATYVQASGRTSRLYPGGITKGLSIVVVDDQRLLNGLVKRMRWLFEELDFKEFKEIDLGKVVREIDHDREIVRKIISGEIAAEKVLEVSKSALLIVESPNKARTIANFFGKPSIRIIGDGICVYDVTTGDYVLSIVASVGHIYDLVVDEGIDGVVIMDGKYIPVYTDIKKCNACGYQFTIEDDKCPKCGSKNITRKLDIVRALQELASEVDLVFIGTDPDTEGEKIGWDLKVLLEPYTREIKRIEFHEVTRKAILNAIRNPRDFDMKLVEAQIIRRVEDRWLGFALSRKLWYDLWPRYCMEFVVEKIKKKKKRKGEKISDEEIWKMCCEDINRNLSAGRVQTPVLGYIIERYDKTINAEEYGLLKYLVIINDGLIELELPQDAIVKLGIEKPKDLIGRKVFVKEVEKNVEEVKPPPPFTTDTLLAEASIYYGLSSTRTMQIAQELFELGFITYHRTDSTRVSDAGIAIARQWLQERYGDRYKELFKPRTWSVGGAHEAIRPTRPIDRDRLSELVREGIIQPARPLTRYHYLVYDLIFRRFIASQMIPAVVVKQVLEVDIDGYKVSVEVPALIKVSGFMEQYPLFSRVCEIESGEYYVTNIIERRPSFARFHDVIKWMKEQGIGRPSTYAKIIQTLIERKYVNVSKKVKALIPTKRAHYVYDFLTKFYKDVVSVETTRKLEELMKMVEEGKVDYQEVLKQIHKELVHNVVNVKSDSWKKMVCREK